MPTKTPTGNNKNIILTTPVAKDVSSAAKQPPPEDSVGVAVGGTDVAVGGTDVAVGTISESLVEIFFEIGIGVGVGGSGTGVAVGGTGVAVGGTGVAVGGTGVGVGCGYPTMIISIDFCSPEINVVVVRALKPFR